MNERQDKKYMGGRPHPFFEVESYCGQQKINCIPCSSFGEVAKHPEIVFHMTDYCFDRAPASEFGLRLTFGMRRCVFSGRIWNLDFRSSNLGFTAKTTITLGKQGKLSANTLKQSMRVGENGLKAVARECWRNIDKMIGLAQKYKPLLWWFMTQWFLSLIPLWLAILVELAIIAILLKSWLGGLLKINKQAA